jgi:hypothetical protein
MSWPLFQAVRSDPVVLKAKTMPKSRLASLGARNYFMQSDLCLRTSGGQTSADRHALHENRDTGESN